MYFVKPAYFLIDYVLDSLAETDTLFEGTFNCIRMAGKPILDSNYSI